MPRFRQVFNKDTGKYQLVEIGAAPTSRGHAIHGDIDAFKSIVDGSVISDRGQLREHNLRNNVVNTDDLRGEGRNSSSSPRWSQEVKREIYERINQLERKR